MDNVSSLFSVQELVVGVGPLPLRKEISLSVGEGQICGVFGQRGAGKRLLLETILGIGPSLKGSRVLAGDSIDGLTQAQLKQAGVNSDMFRTPLVERIMDAFHEPTFEERIHRNALRSPDAKKLSCRQLVDDALDIFGIANARSRTLRNCSGGTGYRCRLAEMWVQKPRLLVLSEPFSAFDSSTTDSLITLLKTITYSYNISVLFTSRRYEVRKHVDVAYLLNSKEFIKWPGQSEGSKTEKEYCEAGADVFISYSRHDSDLAKGVADALTTIGVKVWFDQRSIDPGTRWDDEIQQGLSKTKLVLFLITQTAIESQNVKDEISFALKKGISLLPVMISRCELPLRLQRLQYLNATHLGGDIYDLVCDNVAKRLHSINVT